MRSWLWIAVVALGCSKAGKGASNKDGAIAAWKKGGLVPSAFSEAKTEVGKDCATGTVNKVDVLVCTFGSDKEAKAAEDKGLEWVGDHTGVSKAQGELLIVVADRKHADPQGKTIKQIVALPAK